MSNIKYQTFFCKRISVRLGEHTISTKVDCTGVGPRRICNDEPLQIIPIERFIIHENYVNNLNRRDHRQNDIALIKLKSDAVFNDYVSPVCLPIEANSGMAQWNQVITVVAGWGATENGNFLSRKESEKFIIAFYYFS
jgi:Trypsin